MLKGIITIAASIAKVVLSVWNYFREKKIFQLGKKTQALEDAQEINELHQEAQDIDAEPPMDKSQQLDWMRDRSKND